MTTPVGKQPHKKAQGRHAVASANDVDWERVARDLYRRGIIKLEHLDSRPISAAERAHGVITDETGQSASGIQAGRLMPDQTLGHA